MIADQDFEVLIRSALYSIARQLREGAATFLDGGFDVAELEADIVMVEPPGVANIEIVDGHQALAVVSAVRC